MTKKQKVIATATIFLLLLGMIMVGLVVFQRGEEAGFKRGHEQGYQFGLGEGYSEGWRTGMEKGYQIGYNRGLNEGYVSGYAEGYDEALLSLAGQDVGAGYIINAGTVDATVRMNSPIYLEQPLRGRPEQPALLHMTFNFPKGFVFHFAAGSDIEAQYERTIIPYFNTTNTYIDIQIWTERNEVIFYIFGWSTENPDMDDHIQVYVHHTWMIAIWIPVVGSFDVPVIPEDEKDNSKEAYVYLEAETVE